MNKSLFLAACFAASSGAAAVGASTFATHPYVGSDTEYNITNDAILQAGLGNTSLPGTWDPKTNPLGDYSGGGSGGGESAMVGVKQYTAPMSRMMKGGSNANACKAAQATLQNASGIVTGIDAARVYASNVVLGAATTCNGASSTAACTSDNSGLSSNAGPGATALGFRNWRDVLALLYGGMDRTVSGGRCSTSFATTCDPQAASSGCPSSGTCMPIVDCASSKRQTLVNNWTYLFQNTCNNRFSSNVNSDATSGFCNDGAACTVGSTCSDGVHSCIGIGHGLTHAFRRDDLSGTADVFSNLLLLQGTAAYDPAGNTIGSITISGGGVNAFGVSPYCNSLNWDTTEAGGTGTCFDGSSCTAGQCADGSGFCPVNCGNGAAQHYVGPGGIPVPTATESTQKHHIPPVTCSGSGTDWRCNGAGAVSSAVYGYTQGVALEAAAVQPQVLATSYQDNDPIRTPCLGTATVNPAHQSQTIQPSEDVCNTDGKLGVVLPIPAVDFIKQAAGGTLSEYTDATNCASSFIFANTPNIYKCAPGGAKFANGLCPNNDATLSQGCQVPTGVPTGQTTATTQCTNAKTKLPACEHGNCGQDGRVYNLQALTNPTSGNASWVPYSVAELVSPAVLPFMGAYARIHQRDTSQLQCVGAGANTGAPCTQVGAICNDGVTVCSVVLTPCKLDDATDAIGCLVQADPNSLGFGGNTGDSWEGRSPVALSSGETAPTTAGLRVNGLGAGASCTPTVATSGGKYVANPVANYPLWRKLYFNSLQGFGTVNALSGTTNPNAPAEISLAEWESVAANISPIMGFYGFFVLPQSPLGADSSGTVSFRGSSFTGPFFKPFCEDFNEFKNCVYTSGTTTTPTETGCSGGTCSETAGNLNGCNNNTTVTSSFGTVPSDPSNDPTAATTSTVCGNGIIEFFEDCDFNAPSGTNPPGCTCSATCRCSGGVY